MVRCCISILYRASPYQFLATQRKIIARKLIYQCFNCMKSWQKLQWGLSTKLMFYLTLIPADVVIVLDLVKYIIAERNSFVQLKRKEKKYYLAILKVVKTIRLYSLCADKIFYRHIPTRVSMCWQFDDSQE